MRGRLKLKGSIFTPIPWPPSLDPRGPILIPRRRRLSHLRFEALRLFLIHPTDQVDLEIIMFLAPNILPSNFKRANLLIKLHGEAQFSSRVHSLVIAEEHRLVIRPTLILGTGRVLARLVLAFVPITHQGVVVLQALVTDRGTALVLILIPEGVLGGSLGAVAAVLALDEAAEEAGASSIIIALPRMIHSTSTKL